MSNIAIFKLNQTPQYLNSVNTPDYASDPDVLVNPVIPENVPIKFWKRVGNLIKEMTQAEKQVILDQELEARKLQVDNLNVSSKLIIEGLINAGNLKWSKGQTITKQEIITWLKNNIA